MKKMKLKRFLVLIILIIVTLVTSYTCFSKTLIDDDTHKHHIEYIDTNLTQYTNNMLIASIDTSIKHNQDVFYTLVSEVEQYIKKQSPNAYKGISKYLVQKCLDNNIDICFAMAQTQIETNFGTTGAGRATSRRSLFGVAGRTYSSYENAIDGYIDLLKSSYLCNGKTEQHLMKNYVNKHGYRYASGTQYEVKLKKAYEAIKHVTSIDELQKQHIRS